jgi:MFS transporter, YNFM family, putative membrane transport protein
MASPSKTQSQPMTAHGLYFLHFSLACLSSLVPRILLFSSPLSFHPFTPTASPASHPMSEPLPQAIAPSTRMAILHLSFATFASMTIQRLCDPMLPQLAIDFQAERTQAAHVISFFAITYGLMQIFFGPLGDRYGKYRVLSLATLGCSLGCLGSALAWSLPFLVFCRILTATCTAAIIPLGLAWVGDSVDYQIRQETLAKVGLGSTMGIVAGQLVGGLLTDTLGWRWAFGCMCAVFFVVGWILWSNPNARPKPPKTSISDPSERSLSFATNALAVLSKTRARRLMGFVFLEGCIAFGLLAISATHLHDQQGLRVSWAGGIVSLFGLGGVIYMVWAKWFIHQLGELLLIRLGTLIFGLAYACIGYSTGIVLDVLAFTWAGFGFFMFHNTMQALATQLDPERRGTCMALFACILFGGQSLGVVVCSALISLLGSSGVLLSLGLMLTLMGGVLPRVIEVGRQRNSTMA